MMAGVDMTKSRSISTADTADIGCRLCPRNCNVSRKNNNMGFCGMEERPVVSRAGLHMWEEPCISGKNGSGTVFFCGCNLRCVFCQNYLISGNNEPVECDDDGVSEDIKPAFISLSEWRKHGSTDEREVIRISVDSAELAEIFLNLEGRGAHNINLVTPTHFADQIADAIDLARSKGLSVPIVYNCGGYEKVETLKRLQGRINIWMPDFKYYSDELSIRYSNAAHYFETASAALCEMVRQTGGKNSFDGDGMMTKGVLVRHLVLPGHTADSKRIIRFLHETFGNAVYISIMNQFTPVRELTDYPEINRKLSEEEYKRVVDFAERIGVEQGYIQEGDTAAKSFIPAFDGTGIY